MSGSALMLCERQYWFEDNRDKCWEIFIPCLRSFNEERKGLFGTVLLMLDESMIGWKPKTSKLGGLPNITFKPRKPVDLGSQLKNGAECLTSMFAFQDIVQALEVQKRKKYYYSNEDTQRVELTSLPNSPDMQAHTAEVFHQVEGAGVKLGGWVGGDAWFGSVVTAVEVMHRLGVHSTMIIKGHTHMFPMLALHPVLQARHGKRPAGHWVTMKAKVGGVNLLAIIYAWSQRGCSYFISTCGSTELSPIKYETKFEDDWGTQTSTRLIYQRSSTFCTSIFH
jgi:hypothetical protein